MILICDCDLISMCNEYKILFIEYRIDIEPFQNWYAYIIKNISELILNKKFNILNYIFRQYYYNLVRKKVVQ